MKVIVKIAIEVDPDKWAADQGLPDTRARTVAEDVRGYVLHRVQQLAALEDADAEAALTR